MLSVDALQVHYGSTHAVRDVSFSVQDGRPLGLIGPNGAGKTSVLSALSRLVPSAGRMHFDGYDLGGWSPDRVARAGLIHVPEGRRVFPNLTVRENLLMGLRARGGRASEYDMDDVFDLFTPLRPLVDRLGFALSGGEAQMVAVGRGLLGAPRLMMVDEPSLGLSPLMTEAVTSALIEIGSRTALMVVEQNLQVTARICPEALVLQAGAVVIQGPTADLLASEDVVASYLSG